MTTTPANEADVDEADYLLYGKESAVHAGYVGADKRTAHKDIEWQIARKRGRVKAL